MNDAFTVLTLTWVFLTSSAQAGMLDDAKPPPLESSQPSPALSAPPCLNDSKAYIDRLVSANNALKAALNSDPNQADAPPSRESDKPGDQQPGESNRADSERQAMPDSAWASRVAAQRQGVAAYLYTAAATACWVACAYPPASPSCTAAGMAAEAADFGASPEANHGAEPCVVAPPLTAWSMEHLRGMYSQALSENVRRAAAETRSALESASTAITSCLRKSR